MGLHANRTINTPDALRRDRTACPRADRLGLELPGELLWRPAGADELPVADGMQGAVGLGAWDMLLRTFGDVHEARVTPSSANTTSTTGKVQVVMQDFISFLKLGVQASGVPAQVHAR